MNSNKRTKIEICAYSVQSAINAQKGGAQRVELCDNMFEGGTTPSAATIKLARKYLNIKLHVIIRPRGGDFCYSDIEFETMKQDIEFARAAGVDGVVFGILDADGFVDEKRTNELVKYSSPLSVTFHRAFDVTNDPFRAMETLIDLGVNRILTSGQKQTAFEGRHLIRELVEKADERILIMPGSGINELNIMELKNVTRAQEFHLSAKMKIPSNMRYINKGIKMGGFPGVSDDDDFQADSMQIRRIIQMLH